MVSYNAAKLVGFIKGKKISDKQVTRLVDKGSTVKLKGFKTDEGKVDGIILIGENKQLVFQRIDSTNPKTTKSNPASTDMPTCPKCKKGKLIKGKTAYGCSLWKSGCDLRHSFVDIKKKAAGQKLSKDLVLKIITDSAILRN